MEFLYMLLFQLCFGHDLDGSLVLGPLQLARSHLSEGSFVQLFVCLVVVFELLAFLVELELAQIDHHLVHSPQIVSGRGVRFHNTLRFATAHVPHLFLDKLIVNDLIENEFSISTYSKF